MTARPRRARRPPPPLSDPAQRRLGEGKTTPPGVGQELVAALRQDVALAAADTVLVTIPNQLGVDFTVRQLAALHAIGGELGWND